MAINVYLRGGQSGNDVYLRSGRSLSIDVFLRSGQSGNDVYLRMDGRTPVTSGGEEPPPPFPTQYPGLRFFHGSTQSLCLVATADAPSGDRLTIRKGGTDYAIYLVDTTDPDASTIRIQTAEGIRAIRLLT